MRYRHLDERIMETPAFAIKNAIKEVIYMGEVTLPDFAAMNIQPFQGWFCWKLQGIWNEFRIMLSR